MAEQATEYECDECGATFRDADALTKHRAIHETGMQEKQELEQGTLPPAPNDNPSMPGPGPNL